MSELGKVPSFEPDEEVQALIESMFADKEQTKQKSFRGKTAEKEEVSHNIQPGKRHRLKIPEPPKQNEKQEEEALELAQEELDLIHSAFMEFSETVSDTVVYGHLYNEVLKLTEAFQDFEAMLYESIDAEKITQHGLPDYEKIRKIRQRVLHDVYRHYKEKN